MKITTIIVPVETMRQGKLFPGVIPRNLRNRIWRNKRNSGYEPIISGNKPPGHSRKQKEGVPKSQNKFYQF